MNKSNSIEAIDKTILSEQTKFRLSEIIGIENYFYQEINQRKSCSKKLNKYVTAFDYIDKILIVLSATSSGVSIKTISQALIDMDINHEKFVTILNEKDEYERMKDNLRSKNEK